MSVNQTHAPDSLPDGELVPTRRSLLSRLKQWDDDESWRDFFNTYWKLIYSVAVKAGLSDQEAEDVVQETVISVAKKMGDFKYDPSVCSFKGWLLRITRFRIIDQLRKRQPALQGSRGDRGRDTASTSTLERVPDPAGPAAFEQAWDEEWERNLVDAAMERVKLRVKPEHYQVFYLSAVKGVGPREVARTLQVNVGRVYLIRHRIAKEVKREIERLRVKPL